MKLIGLTGPSGAGKSSLAAALALRGLPVIDADAVYSSVLVPPSGCLDRIRGRFGDGVIASDGTLDRRALSSIVFADGNEAELAALNEITHGYVLAEIERLLARYREAGTPAVCADVPLLFESGFDRKCDLTVAVLADKSLRILRIEERDRIGYGAASARINAQKDDGYYTSRADTVFYNNGGKASVDAEADRLLSLINGD